MAEDSPLRNLLLRQKEAEATKSSAQREAKELTGTHAASVPAEWERALTGLNRATKAANDDFSAVGFPNRFRFEPRPQPGSGNVAYGVLAHRDSSDRIGNTSEIEVLVRSTGSIELSSRVRKRRFEAESITVDDWSEVILETYEIDSGVSRPIN